ncbi:3-O-alpha-D-mannopyranosyl-alpha-D-mannopyranosexylosylphosphotransferase [Rhizoctonia solani]|uniref:3-O-alpha-D-mannopyranosyl-alpha-D-mannopyranosex ylosylphosphotransferase n=1 Tax=Rhizoctonia solani TaxID=456999 RepID=A0A0K6FSC0_9AGAM|nr:3-O-alpha-D-mannopyranosyl-alpha-D-mannopyranosexylosylphosphotransferase [Rhizoctonia solani]
MPSTRAYSLLPTSSSTETLHSPGRDEVEFEEAWPSERPATHGWFPLTAALATRRSRPRHTYTVAVAALSTIFILIIISTLHDSGLVVDLSTPSPSTPESTFREPTVRDCFELPSDELVWQTTQLPAERSEQCPFDPESFAVLQESPYSAKSKPGNVQWSNECLEDMLAKGQVQPRSCDQSHSQTQKIDLVWTWVNGSSTLLEFTRRDRVAQVSGLPPAELETETIAGLAAKLFRDHDELRHSVRAALKHFDAESNVKADFFIVGSDMPVSVHGLGMDDDPATGEARVGQLPSWLDIEEMGPKGEFTNWSQDGKQTRLQVRHHRDIFSDYEGTVFNSLAIESQFLNLDKIGVSDIFVYVNDDVFFSRDLSPRDFHMQEQGIVMRMQNYIPISPDPSVPQHDGLEWESLQYSNHLLSNRFGSRLRPYPAHLAKTLSIPMLKEVAQAWPEDLARVVRRPFRGMKHMVENEPADMYMVFMEHHWIVERWREALLWSWVVARGEVRTGGNTDSWTEQVSKQAWKELGGQVGEDILVVQRAPRSTLENADEWTGAKSTTVAFSSLDGYPYSEDMGERGWVATGDVCELSFERCFASHDTASRTFQRIAFEEPIECGDCIVRALINQSGKRGLEAFLPPKSNRPFSRQARPTLPLSSSWDSVDFTLKSVVPDWVDTRQFVLRMLQQYRFVLGDTPFVFAIVTDPDSAAQNVQVIDSRPELAILCVNDDVAEGDDRVRDILEQWMSGRWNQSAEWEQR